MLVEDFIWFEIIRCMYFVVIMLMWFYVGLDICVFC